MCVVVVVCSGDFMWCSVCVCGVPVCVCVVCLCVCVCVCVVSVVCCVVQCDLNYMVYLVSAVILCGVLSVCVWGGGGVKE